MEFGSWIFSYPPPEKFPAVLSRTFTPPLKKKVSARMIYISVITVVEFHSEADGIQ